MVTTNPRRNMNFGGVEEINKRKEEKEDMALALVPTYTLRLSTRVDKDTRSCTMPWCSAEDARHGRRSDGALVIFLFFFFFLRAALINTFFFGFSPVALSRSSPAKMALSLRQKQMGETR
jgi:hypothetical protein